MKPTRRPSRRSFLGQVAGGAVTAGALGVIGGEARAWQTGPYTGINDNDSGSHADNAGHGRGPGGNANGRPVESQTGQTGYSDSDSGANADPSGGGRRGRPVQTGITDRDPHDPYGQGRGTSMEGRGRNGYVQQGNGNISQYTGITDTDSGANRDPYGYGHGSRDCRDSDSQQRGWQNGDPARRCE
jgi:hypothetical protein